MKLSPLALIAAAAFAAIPAAHGGDNPAATRPTEVRGVKLASICAACGVVSDTRVETRAGKGTGVGAVGGAVVGGLVGHQIGSGKGNTVATVLGAVGGGVAGNAIEKKARKETVWSTTVTFKDGTIRTFEQTTAPGLDAGDVVTVRDGRPVKRAL
ncbi:glycine zipper 2TM domain-containing protein [Piscinibacter sp. XHJ-5]|uniref:glycine zipper 2TM domain-containing protein n=1 Tax=Piscinibacter sp. XHJ-5 TaxID=3037797 RepID=UPI0024537379|nr:glycine zipper 2TM domain-containing protein [Piscinibacter sp. XHJ-5]